MLVSQEFRRSYADLEARMKAQAEADGDVYLPNPEPSGPVDYLFICMEPSLGHWARSAEEANSRVAAGFRNFLAGIDPMLLHFAVRQFLCRNGQRYHVTDFSKGAMLVERAGSARTARYDRWYDLLQEEVGLLTVPDSHVVAVGGDVASHLKKREFSRPVSQVLHYSPLAGRARSECVRGREHEFAVFAKGTSKSDLLAMARAVLSDAAVPPDIYRDALSIIERAKLSESRLKLLFCYKLQFEALGA